MEKQSTLFTGIFGAFIISCGVMVLLPSSQIGALQPQVTWDEGQNSPSDVYPVKLENALGRRPGQSVYAENGCFYCHTQQVRDPQYGADMERGWGVRRTVARDYIFQSVPLLGSTRLGPDLANFGSGTWRNEHHDDRRAPAKRDAAWIYKHLYSPKSNFPDSNCPPYPYLFERKDVGGQPSPDAVAVEGNHQVVPTADARNLAKYLLSLNSSHELKESPTVIKPKEAKK
jgi:cytochrome c oxidase cbb3-type subunit 2